MKKEKIRQEADRLYWRSVTQIIERCQFIKERCNDTLKGKEGMGVVEVILIIVVLIGLVIIFQTNIKSVVASIFSTIESNAGSVQ